MKRNKHIAKFQNGPLEHEGLMDGVFHDVIVTDAHAYISPITDERMDEIGSQELQSDGTSHEVNIVDPFSTADGKRRGE